MPETFSNQVMCVVRWKRLKVGGLKQYPCISWQFCTSAIRAVSTGFSAQVSWDQKRCVSQAGLVYRHLGKNLLAISLMLLAEFISSWLLYWARSPCPCWLSPGGHLLLKVTTIPCHAAAYIPGQQQCIQSLLCLISLTSPSAASQRNFHLFNGFVW